VETVLGAASSHMEKNKTSWKGGGKVQKSWWGFTKKKNKRIITGPPWDDKGKMKAEKKGPRKKLQTAEGGPGWHFSGNLDELKEGGRHGGCVAKETDFGGGQRSNIDR